jgi:ketosteroid isomerase-like protein
MEVGADRVKAMYGAFNARDLEAVLEQMCADVDWPKAWEGGRVHGREAVRDYWTRQWAAIDPTVEPVAFTIRKDGRVAVDVHQTVRGLDGALLGERTSSTSTSSEGLIARMDIDE